MVALMFFVVGTTLAQSNEGTSTTRSTVVKDKEALKAATPKLSPAEMEAIKQRASKAKKVSTLETKQQLNARAEERARNHDSSAKTKSEPK